MNIIQKHLQRNFWYIFLIIFFFTIGFWSGNASAETPTIKSKRSVSIAKRPEFKPSVLITTTTTIAPKQNVAVQMVDVPTPQNNPTPVITDIDSQCRQWVLEAGVPVEDLENAMWLIGKESGCRVDAHNPSGAHGIPQALPGSKMASAGEDYLTNPVTQIRWMHSYVIGRYGSWANACAHSRSHNWY